ncbi:MAG TPA: metal ABC transporter permease, partial [Acidimicrobiales bacterium]|nr:metal ABC transporter permease [Acidimicrobiales bacterium]
MSVLHAVFPPGFFSSEPVQAPAVVGTVVALVCAPVGVFTVVRGQSFAGHAFADITATGGSAAFLLGVSPLVGFVVFALAGGGAIELLGAERQRSRDLATGVLLGAGLGLSALLLYLSTSTQSTTGAAVTVLFGSIFAVSSSVLPLVIGFGAVALVLIG